MPETAHILFWTSLFILFYTYAGYPIILYTITRFRRRNVPIGQYKLAIPVTLVIAAYNEAAILEEKLHNSVELNYDPQLLHIIVITDGSTDGGQDIVRRFPSVTLLDQPQRKGKLAAMNRAMEKVQTPIVIFSDANTLLNADCITNIVAHYTNAEIGGVAGEKRVRASGPGTIAAGEGLYWRYESFIKALDSELYTIVGAAGELFSLRSDLYTVLPEDTIIEDFVQSLTLCKKGYRVAYEPAAYSLENASADVRDELERKVRISAGAFQAMAMLSSLFNVFRYPVLSFQFISHRVLRWTLCPLALPALLGCSVVLGVGQGGLFYWFMVVQLIFYVAAIVGWRLALTGKKLPLLQFIFYFFFMHACVFAGFWRFVRGKQDPNWRKATRLDKI